MLILKFKKYKIFVIFLYFMTIHKNFSFTEFRKTIVYNKEQDEEQKNIIYLNKIRNLLNLINNFITTQEYLNYMPIIKNCFNEIGFLKMDMKKFRETLNKLDITADQRKDLIIFRSLASNNQSFNILITYQLQQELKNYFNK